MIRFVILILTIGFLAFSCSQKIAVIQSFEPGQSLDFEVERAKENSFEPVSNGISVVTSITAYVDTSEKENLMITLEYGESRIEGAKLPPEVVDEFKKQELYYGFKIAIMVDQFGSYIGFINYDNVKNQVLDAMVKIYQQEMDSIDQNTLQQIMKLLEPTLNSEEAMLETYFPEVAMYFGTLGRTYTLDKLEEYEYDTPNPFGGSPIPLSGKSQAKKNADSVVKIKSEEIISAENLQEIMESMFSKISDLGGKPIDQNEIPKFKMLNVMESEYNLSSQILESTSITKHIFIQGQMKKSFTEMRILKP